MSYGTVQAEKMTTESGYSLGAGNASSFKNRIINGAMVIDQRNNGASVTANDSTYAVDRTYFNMQTSGKGTGQRSTDAPAGFTNSLLYTNGSAYTVGTGETYGIVQNIEGYNIADLAWGTASAKSATLSFWVKSSVTGTFGGAVKTASGGTAYTYAYEYTINSANTWEYKTVTIPGPTVGTWPTDNNTGIRIAIGLGNGSSNLIAPNSWTASNSWSSTGAVSVLATAGATWRITGIQFEVGTVATSFDYRPYGTELALCQRYYEQFGNGWWCSGETTNYNVVYGGSFLVPKRTAPTCSLLYTDLVIYQFGVANRNGSGCSIITASQMFTWGGQIKVAGWSTITTGQLYGGGGSVAAGFTVQPMAASAEL